MTTRHPAPRPTGPAAIRAAGPVGPAVPTTEQPMLKNLKTRREAARRHRALTDTANTVVSRHIIAGDGRTATTGEIVALAFGRHQLRVTHAEALDHLNAQLAERSLPLRPAGTPQACA